MLDWMQRAARPARPLPHRTSDTGGGVIQGSASEATLVVDPVGAVARHRRRRQSPSASRPRSSPTRRRRRTRASRRVCASPASAPTDCASSPTTSAFAMRADALAEMVARRRRRRAAPVLGLLARTGRPARWRSTRRRDRRRIAQRHGMWLHVDAAMSGIAALSPAAAVGQRRARAGRQLLHEPAQVDGRQLRLRPVLDRRPRGAARRAEHPARVPPLGGRRDRRRRSTTATGRSRSAGASGR